MAQMRSARIGTRTLAARLIASGPLRIFVYAHMRLRAYGARRPPPTCCSPSPSPPGSGSSTAWRRRRSSCPTSRRFWTCPSRPSPGTCRCSRADLVRDTPIAQFVLYRLRRDPARTGRLLAAILDALGTTSGCAPSGDRAADRSRAHTRSRVPDAAASARHDPSPRGPHDAPHPRGRRRARHHRAGRVPSGQGRLPGVHRRHRPRRAQGRPGGAARHRDPRPHAARACRGYDVLAELRRREETRDVGVILLTARREEADRIRGLSLGADDYLTKPFSPQELSLRVRGAAPPARRARGDGGLDPDRRARSPSTARRTARASAARSSTSPPPSTSCC